MSKSNWTALDCARQYLGMREVPGHKANPAILAMLQLDMKWPEDDATPWCSGFVNWVAFNMGLERTNKVRTKINGRLVKVPLLARSWLRVGTTVTAENANGNTVVILKRGGSNAGPEIVAAPGHVGFVADVTGERVLVLGGNQSDKGSERWYPRHRVLGFRKLKRA